MRDWRKAEVNLAAIKKTKKANRGLRAGGTSPQVGAAGRGLSTVQLRLHALVLAKEMNRNDFADEPSCCYRFMQRNRLSIRAQMHFSINAT